MTPPQPVQSLAVPNAELRIANVEKEDEVTEKRKISNAAVRRLARKRNSKGQSKHSRATSQLAEAQGDEDSDLDEIDDDGYSNLPVMQTTSNHYTLNMPGSAPTNPDTPSVLLG